MYVLMSILKSIAAVLLMAVISMVIKKICMIKPAKNARLRTMQTLINSTIHYLCALIAIIWILTIFEVNVNTIFASVGIVALIVGFSAESLIADVITGIFIIFENQYNVGDVIEVDGYRGTVSQIGIRTMSIRDGGNNIKVFNNSHISDIVNLSLTNSKAVSDIRIDCKEDLEKVEAALNEILNSCYEAHKDIFLAAPEYAGVQELDNCTAVLRVSADVEEENIFAGRRLLNRDLLMGLKKRGIEIGYRQQDDRG